MMTRYLQGLRIKPGPLLSTALLYGIRTDTATFERSGGEDDLRAYQWLIKHADATPAAPHHPQRVPARLAAPFSPARSAPLRDCRGGAMVWLNEVDSADLLVAVADFFTRVHGLAGSPSAAWWKRPWWSSSAVTAAATSAVWPTPALRRAPPAATATWAARNSPAAIPAGTKPADFIFQRLHSRKLRPVTASAAPLAENAGQQAVHSETLEPAPVQALAHGA